MKKWLCLAVLCTLVSVLHATPSKADIERVVKRSVLTAQRDSDYLKFSHALEIFRDSVRDNRRTEEGYYVGAYEVMDMYFEARQNQPTETTMKWFEALSEKFDVPREFSKEVFAYTTPYHYAGEARYYGPASAFDYLAYMVNTWVNRKPIKYEKEDIKQKRIALKQDKRAFKKYKKNLAAKK